jgi:hypothetical protein
MLNEMLSTRSWFEAEPSWGIRDAVRAYTMFARHPAGRNRAGALRSTQR